MHKFQHSTFLFSLWIHGKEFEICNLFVNLRIRKVIYMRLFQYHILLFSLCCLTESESHGYYFHEKEKVHNWRSNAIFNSLYFYHKRWKVPLINGVFFIFRDEAWELLFLFILKALSYNLFIKLLGFLVLKIYTKGQ